jgi:dethiobiotin synthetase
VASGLLEAANRKGLATVAIKPIAAGCEQTEHGLRNRDALILQQAMSIHLPYEQVNPIALAPAIAPHIAAGQVGKMFRVDQLVGYCRGVMMQPSDFMVIEGVGGWRVPLNRVETLAGLAKELQAPVILVVGMRLGCISHALLTAEAIQRDGLPLVGWVANRIEPSMSCYQENLSTLKSMIPGYFLGEVPYLQKADAQSAADHLDISALIAG